MPEPLRVDISREPFGDLYLLKYGNGQSEELEAEEARQWFVKRGADVEQVNKALDYAYNFYQAVFTIENPIDQPLIFDDPQGTL